MKTGYLIWSMGWVCIGLGIAFIAMGVSDGEGLFLYGIIRGLVIIGVSAAWFKWGKSRIQKEVIKRLQDGNDG